MKFKIAGVKLRGGESVELQIDVADRAAARAAADEQGIMVLRMDVVQEQRESADATTLQPVPAHVQEASTPQAMPVTETSAAACVSDVRTDAEHKLQRDRAANDEADLEELSRKRLAALKEYVAKKRESIDQADTTHHKAPQSAHPAAPYTGPMPPPPPAQYRGPIPPPPPARQDTSDESGGSENSSLKWVLRIPGVSGLVLILVIVLWLVVLIARDGPALWRQLTSRRMRRFIGWSAAVVGACALVLAVARGVWLAIPKYGTPPSWPKMQVGEADTVNFVDHYMTRFTLVSATIGRVPLRMHDGTTTLGDPALILRLRITNRMRTTVVDCLTYEGRQRRTYYDYALLQDSAGNDYRLMRYRPAAQPDDEFDQRFALKPSESVEDLLVFEIPAIESGVLMLVLPGENVGADGYATMRFSIESIVRP